MEYLIVLPCEDIVRGKNGKMQFSSEFYIKKNVFDRIFTGESLGGWGEIAKLNLQQKMRAAKEMWRVYPDGHREVLWR